jgi:hypothetical protein
MLSTPVDEKNYKHPHAQLYQRASPRHVTLADRAALHLGLALITWSRRARVVAPQPGRDELRARYATSVARAERERSAERTLRLNLASR